MIGPLGAPDKRRSLASGTFQVREKPPRRKPHPFAEAFTPSIRYSLLGIGDRNENVVSLAAA
jgi:hypothetical protein